MTRRGFRLWENLYYHRLQGTIDASLYSTWRDNFSRMYAQRPAMRLYWMEEQKEFSQAFREEMERVFDAHRSAEDERP
jgi:hypothetical protein